MPYGGFGFRYLNNGFNGEVTSAGASGYGRESKYYYLPLGLDLKHNLIGHWLAAYRFEYDLFLSGLQVSHFEDADDTLPTIKNKQDSGYGLRGSIKFINPGERFNMVIEPFFQYWHIEESKLETSPQIDATEPQNKTREVGLSLGVQY